MEELEAGRVIGSYRVVCCIGKGGMGTFYGVEHVERGVRYHLQKLKDANLVRFVGNPKKGHWEVS